MGIFGAPPKVDTSKIEQAQKDAEEQAKIAAETAAEKEKQLLADQTTLLDKKKALRKRSSSRFSLFLTDGPSTDKLGVG